MKALNLFDHGPKLPIETCTQTLGIFGIRGSGKSYAAMKLAEEIVGSGVPIISHDPTGAWFGLKSRADGKGPGLPIYIFGGEHADIPLEESAGELIAKTLVERRVPAVLDTSLLRKGARIRFMADFLEALYHHNRDPLHFFADEAHTIAPNFQRKSAPELARVLGAMEDILTMGRRRGLGCTLISQRPALVNTSCRNMCETLVAMRIIGPHDRKAIEEWVFERASDVVSTQMIDELAKLKTGEGWLWSPTFLQKFEPIIVGKRWTFDSSATPKAGQKVKGPTQWAKVDINALGEAIKSAVEKKKADDPAALRQRIHVLEKELKARARVKFEKPARQLKPEKPTKTFLLMGPQTRKLESALKTMAKLHEKFADAVFRVESAQKDLLKVLRQVTTKPQYHEPKVFLSMNQRLKQHEVETLPQRRPVRQFEAGDSSSQNGSYISGSLKERILKALKWWEAIGVDAPSRAQVAFACGCTVNGHFTNMLSELRTELKIQYPKPGCVQLDPDVHPEGPPKAPMLGELISRMQHILGENNLKRRIFDRLLSADAYEHLTREDLAQALGLTVNGHFTNMLSELRSAGIITYPKPGRVSLSDVITKFPQS